MMQQPKLTPASGNPWYALMTVAGEQTGKWVDRDLHARNRRFWSGWAAGELDDKAKAALIDEGRATAEDLAPLTGAERDSIAEALRSRCGGAKMPEPGGTAKLSRLEFSERLACRGFIFSGYAKFREATFSGYADFGEATFAGGADFGKATFSGYAVFGEATFSGDADFSNSRFESRTLFTGARFLPPKAGPPQFFNATLHEDTDWTDVAWPGPPRDRAEAIAHRRAYERLKLVMDGQKKFHDEHMFLRKELRCREIEEPRGWASIASRFYRWSSDYGWSIQRPAAGLAGLLLGGWALIFLAEWWDLWFGGGDYLGPGQSFAVSLSNVFGFLGFARTFLADEMKTLTVVSEIVSAVQTIVGLVLFFLLGLSLRNQFRMK